MITLASTTAAQSDKITFFEAGRYLDFERWWKSEGMESTYRLDVPSASELVVTATFNGPEERMLCLLRWR